MSFRPALLKALLVFLLLVTQQMGLAHALSHLSGARQGSSQDQHLPGSEHCDQCLAFAATGSGITSHAVVFSPGLFGDVALSKLATWSFSPPANRPFEARAPPDLI